MTTVVQWVRSGLSFGLLLSAILYSGCSMIYRTPPGQAPIIPNGSLVTAYVQTLQYMPGNSLKRLYLEVLTSKPLRPGLPSLIAPGQTLWANTRLEIALELLGQTIRAVARLVGDERGQQLWIDQIEVLTP